MKSLVLCISLSVLNVGVTFGQTAQDPPLPEASPESVGMSATHLAQFDTLAAKYVDTGRLAGVVALVVRDGNLVYESVHGVLDVDSGQPMRSNSIFRIASQTKLVVSVAVMILVEDGLVRLDEPVANHIPEFAETTVAVMDGDSVRVVPASRQITIQDLLTHSSGIPGPDPEFMVDQYAAASLIQTQGLLNYLDEPIGTLVRRLAELPYASQPGEELVYGYSTDVLGAVVEQAGGLALDEFLRSRIFIPVGMPDTEFFLQPDKLDRLVANHIFTEEGGLRRASDDDMGWDGQGAFVEGPRRLFQGSGGLLSTAYDYARFLQMLLNEGELDGVRILSPASVHTITQNHVGGLYARALDYPGMGFGFNVEVKLDSRAGGYDVPPLASVGAFGWGGACYTTFWVDPGNRLIGVFMAQLRSTRIDLARKFGDVVYEAMVSPGR